MIDTSEEEIINQTEFGAASPWLNGAKTAQAATHKTSTPPVSWKVKLRQPKYQLGLVLAAIVTLMILGLITVAVVVNTRVTKPTPTPRPTARPGVEGTSFEKRVEVLRTELEESDPTLEVLPLPPIDARLRLEDEGF